MASEVSTELIVTTRPLREMEAWDGVKDRASEYVQAASPLVQAAMVNVSEPVPIL